MEKFWTEALKATGPVAVIGFIVWFVVQQFFSTELISIFSSQQRFVITLLIVSALLIILYATLKWHYASKDAPATSETVGSRTANITESNIQGDFVMGDKTGEK